MFDDKQWPALSDVLGEPIWMASPLFVNISARKINQSELDKMLAKETSRFEAEELLQALRKTRITAGLVRNADDLANDPHLRERGFFVTLGHPGQESMVVDASPIRFMSEGPAP